PISGCVDFVSPPDQIAQELSRLARSLAGPEGEEQEVEPGAKEKELKKILDLLRRHNGVDFSLYKPNTIERRIKRRMLLRKIARLNSYAAHLRDHRAEREALYQDLLISVTSFFRNPESF